MNDHGHGKMADSNNEGLSNSPHYTTLKTVLSTMIFATSRKWWRQVYQDRVRGVRHRSGGHKTEHRPPKP